MHNRQIQMRAESKKPVALGKGSVKFNGMSTRTQFGKAGHKPEGKIDDKGNILSNATVDITKRQKALSHIPRADAGHLKLNKMTKRDKNGIIGHNQWVKNIEEENKQWDYLQLICTSEKKKSSAL